MTVSSKSRFFAVSGVALLSLGVLAGCGPDVPSFDEASSSASASAEAVIPDGYQKVTAPSNKISFAIPDDWAVLTSQELADSKDVEATLEEAGESFNMTNKQLKDQMDQVDLFAREKNPVDSNFVTNVNILSEPDTGTSLPTEGILREAVSEAGGVPDEFRTISTPLGDAASLTYDIDANGKTVHGVYLLAPNGQANSYSHIVVTSSNADTANKLINVIAASLSQAF